MAAMQMQKPADFVGSVEELQEEVARLVGDGADFGPDELSKAARLVEAAATRLSRLATSLAEWAEMADGSPQDNGQEIRDSKQEAVKSPSTPSPSSVPTASEGARHEVGADEWEQILDRFDGVDPYAAWLGISVDHRPLNPYELLGVQGFEATHAKLAAGMERMTSRLKSVQGGVNQEHWQLVYDELEAAYTLLQDRQQREELDASLKRIEARRGMLGAGAQAASADGKINCHCGCENNARRVFCTACGGPLWRRCAACNSDRTIDEGHCGQCGVNLEEAEHRLLGECQQKIDAAMALASEHQYDKAMLTMRRVLLLEDPRLHELIESARELRSEIAAKQREMDEERERRLASAQECLAKGDFGEAAEQLLAVPEPVRTEDFQRVLDSTVHQRDALQKAEAELQEFLKRKKLTEMSGPIERILAIRPDYKSVIDLAEKVRDKLCEAAAARIENNNLSLAHEFLSCVPEPVVNDRVLDLREALRDRSGLMDYLSKATVVSGNHVVAAKRLADLTGSEEAAALHKQAKAAWDKSKRLPLAAWREPEESTRVGCPVHWMLYPRVEVADGHKEAFAREPASWFVACGLALQGLGLARRSIDFVNKKGGLGSLFTRKQAHDAVWGIDVGSHAIKIVRLRRSGEEVVCDHAEKLRMPAGNSEAAVLELLGGVRDRLNLKGQPVAVAFSAKLANVRTAMLPPLQGKKLGPVLEREASALFPMDVTDLSWRCDVGETSDERKFGVFAAVKKATVDREMARWSTSLGIEPAVLTIDALAARNAWAWQNKDADANVALLDIGETGAVLSLENEGRLWVRVLSTGGNQLTDAITGALKITRDQADAVKRDFSGVDNVRPMFDSLQSVMQRLQQDVVRKLDALRTEFDDMRCDGLTCVGGSSLMTGLIDVLRQN